METYMNEVRRGGLAKELQFTAFYTFLMGSGIILFKGFWGALPWVVLVAVYAVASYELWAFVMNNAGSLLHGDDDAPVHIGEDWWNVKSLLLPVIAVILIVILIFVWLWTGGCSFLERKVVQENLRFFREFGSVCTVPMLGGMLVCANLSPPIIAGGAGFGLFYGCLAYAIWDGLEEVVRPWVPKELQRHEEIDGDWGTILLILFLPVLALAIGIFVVVYTTIQKFR